MTQAKNYSIVSIALIALSALVALLSSFGTLVENLGILFISDPDQSGFASVFSGQIWRLLTPAFIHFGPMHLIFNLLWVWDLGMVIENRKGPGFYLSFFVVAAVISNVAQYLLTSNPFFGGMSGVVYGLFSYVWMRGRYDPAFNGIMRKATVNMMLAWFVLCWTGLLGPIANWAHTMGLVVGAVWAYLECKSLRLGQTSASPPANKVQSLEYFSTADILKAEALRSWVKDQYLPEARQQFDTRDGKLKIITSILQQKGIETRPSHETQAMEIVFADALIQETGLNWAVIDDDHQRTFILLKPGTPPLSFSLVPATRIAEAVKDGKLNELFQTSVQTIRNSQLPQT
ncbi:MAG: rhomboid family intramembrane serine protease [Undibacterium umbellatum]|uniref:rhomboid family intramembrane serine protease n=1 Tax=Undibacterium umbellatum TaxID=2762300 RepID=UPI003BB4E894